MHSKKQSAAYVPHKIEKKWQDAWAEKKIYRAPEPPRKKYYQLETFPYPSAAGLHVGHPKGYIAEDIHARFMRMNGYDVLYTMGWDAFGLPTENYAIKIGTSPKEVARASVKNYKRQVQMFGLTYDWDREINTSAPEYYRWTQWIFIQLFKKGLAYRKKANVNWCPKDKTVLANEQVQGGVCDRCGTTVVQKEMDQWFLKITDYAERLLTDLTGLDWPAATIKRQKDWIGKSEGAEIEFRIQNEELRIKVFTTRPDTLFGATYVVLAPEHELVEKLKEKIANYAHVRKYIDATLLKTELQRQEDAGEKTGVELQGVKALNPATHEEIPIWIADYILGSYGTGAIMAVPAHDFRDNEFAQKFLLPIRQVVHGEQLDGGLIYEGTLVNSGEFTGLGFEEAKWKITKAVGGKKTTQYKLRDWSVSRQRYWGVPIPMVYCSQCGIVPVPESDLPVLLPDDIGRGGMHANGVDYRPQGMPPLASSKSFMRATCPLCGGAAQRDPETLDTFVDSSWYYLRYTDPHNTKAFAAPKKIAQWMPVDLYVIGAEHTVLHLLYSRFITKFLHDEGYLSFAEPFKKIRHVGLLLGADGRKMSKSKGNVVNPDGLLKEYGADAFRVYEMFMGPFEDGQPWDETGVIGAERFLKRFWRYALASREARAGETPGNLRVHLHKTLKRVSDAIPLFQFNAAIAELMKLLNAAEAHAQRDATFLSKDDLESYIKMLHPFAPHICQELWSQLGHDSFVDYEPWPVHDSRIISTSGVMVGVQVDGKRRAEVMIAPDMGTADVRSAVLAMDSVKRYVEGREIKNFIYVKNKIVSIVTSPR